MLFCQAGALPAKIRQLSSSVKMIDAAIKVARLRQTISKKHSAAGREVAHLSNVLQSLNKQVAPVLAN